MQDEPVVDVVQAEVKSILEAIELDLKDLCRTEFESPEVWTPTVYKKAIDRLEKAEKADAHDFIDFLDLSDLIEAVNRNKDRGVVDPQVKCSSLSASDIQILINARNDVHHFRRLTNEQCSDVVGVLNGMNDRGFRGSRCVDSIQRLSSIEDTRKLFTKNRPVPSNILNNLPPRDYEDTGFVGRTELIKKIEKCILSRHSLYGYLWLCGPGGVGKTALALEVVERIISSPECPFEAVLWVSFKNNELTDRGIIPIVDAIRTIDEMISELGAPLDLTPGLSLEDFWRQIDGLPMLVVLDNCETYPGQMDDFLDSNPPESLKFLFTSRKRGDFGSTIEVPRLTKNESISLLKKLALAYSVHEFKDIIARPDALENLLQKVGESPLALKWVSRLCGSGEPLESVLRQKGDLVKYCVGSLYQDLSVVSKLLISLLHQADSPLSIGEVTSYLSDNSNIDVIDAIKDLYLQGLVIKTIDAKNLISKYELVDALTDYLLFSHSIDKQIHGEAKARIKANRDLQSINQNKLNSNFFSPHVCDGLDSYPQAAAELFRLLKPRAKRRLESDEVSKGDLERRLNVAQAIAESNPDYWEAHRAVGEILWWLGAYRDSIEAHKKALDTCPADLARSHSRLNYFLSLKYGETNNNDALSYALKAYELFPNDTTALNLGKCSCWCGNFSQAIDISSKILESGDTLKVRLYAGKDLIAAYVRASFDAKEKKDYTECIRYSKAALTTWLQTVELLWDVPEQDIAFRDAIAQRILEGLGLWLSSLHKSRSVDSSDIAYCRRVVENLDSFGYPILSEIKRSEIPIQEIRHFLSWAYENGYNSDKFLNTKFGFPNLTEMDERLVAAGCLSATGTLTKWSPENHGLIEALIDGRKKVFFLPIGNLVHKGDKESFRVGVSRIKFFYTVNSNFTSYPRAQRARIVHIPQN